MLRLSVGTRTFTQPRMEPVSSPRWDRKVSNCWAKLLIRDLMAMQHSPVGTAYTGVGSLQTQQHSRATVPHAP